MTKSEFISAVAEKANLSKKDAESAINAVTEAITEALAEGDKVSLVGFGTFSVKDRAARTGINPRTNNKYKSSEHLSISIGVIFIPQRRKK